MSEIPSLQPDAGPAGHPAPGVPKGSNGLATTGFVLGLIGLLLCWIPVVNFLGILLGVLGVVFGAIGLVRSKRVNAGKGLAIAGIVLGVLAVVLAIVINVAFVNSVDDALDDATDTSVKAPKDSPSDTGAPRKDDLGKTRQNPAPIGSEITGGDWAVTVNSVKTANQDKYGSKAAAGHVLLFVNVTATYKGDDAQGDSVWANVKYVGADGTTIDSSDGSTLFISDHEFDSLKTIYAGGKITGDQIIEVPADWQSGVLAVTPDAFSDDTFVVVK